MALNMMCIEHIAVNVEMGCKNETCKKFCVYLCARILVCSKFGVGNPEPGLRWYTHVECDALFVYVVGRCKRNQFLWNLEASPAF